ncbi:MAG: DHCW motif cupin fold protein [Phycisphaerales bacterium]
MKIEHVPFTAIEWGTAPRVEQTAQTGRAWWRTVEAGNIRVRMVEYSPGYAADHWCGRGHVVLVLKGELFTRLKDGREFVTRAGECWMVSDGDGEHRSTAKDGAVLFIVD